MKQWKGTWFHVIINKNEKKIGALSRSGYRRDLKTSFLFEINFNRLATLFENNVLINTDKKFKMQNDTFSPSWIMKQNKRLKSVITDTSHRMRMTWSFKKDFSNSTSIVRVSRP